MLGFHWLDIMPFHGLIFLFFISFAELCSWPGSWATLHHTATVAMATGMEAANSAAAVLAGAAAASWARGFMAHGKVGAWLGRCFNALVHECMGVGACGCKGRHPTGGTAPLCSLAGMNIPQRATGWEQTVPHRNALM